MSSFEETIARMKGLYTYGKELNENKNFNTHTLEYHTIGADGKSYGIVKECNKYYIKTAPQQKEMVAEAYDYIGGFCNRKSYEYNSYASALKNFEMKLASINEAFDGNVNISTLDPFKKEEYIVEGTRKMQDEIARCRQIMYNTAMIMNESIEGIGATKDGDVVKNNTKRQPEAPKSGKTDEITKGKAAKLPKENPSAGKSGNKPGKDGVFTEKPKGLKEGKCCEKCGEPNGKCTCKNCNEESCDIGDNPLMPNTENWGTEGICKGRDPKSIGWEMDGQKKVNEETDEWDEGLPNSAGVGDADTSHNNDPFNKSINEEDEDYLDDTESNEGGDMSTDTDFDAGLDDEYSDGESEDDFGDDFSSDEEGDEFGDEFSDDFSDDEDGSEFSDEGGDDFPGEGEEEIEISNDDDGLGDENGDLQAQIDALKAQIEQLQSQLNGESDDFSDEEGSDEFSDDFSDEEGEDEFGDEYDSDYSDEGSNDFSGENGGDFSDGEDEDFSNEDGEDFSSDSDDFSDEDNPKGYSDDDEIDECGVGGNIGRQNAIMEAKRRKMNKIIESVTKRILKEEELHVFGKHPGYRKKPMELPSTGEDKNQWGRDWNDESVHGEEPFGSKIGNGDPFNKLVDAITKDVMYQLKKGIPIEGENKKKVD